MEKIKNLLFKYKEAILYLIFGVLTTAVNWVVYFPLTKLTPIHYQVATVISWIAAVVFAYFTNREFVFLSKNKNKIMEFIKFTSGRIFSLLAEMAVLFLLIEIIAFHEDMSKIFGQVIVVILNYIISKVFVFKNDEK